MERTAAQVQASKAQKRRDALIAAALLSGSLAIGCCCGGFAVALLYPLFG